MQPTAFNDALYFCELYEKELQETVRKDAELLGNARDLFGHPVDKPNQTKPETRDAHKEPSIRIVISQDELVEASSTGLRAFVTLNCLKGALNVDRDILGDAPGIAYEIGIQVTRRILSDSACHSLAKQNSKEIRNYSFVAGRNGALKCLRSNRIPVILTDDMNKVEDTRFRSFGNDLFADLFEDSRLELLPVIWDHLVNNGRIPTIRDVARITKCSERTTRRRLRVEKNYVVSAFANLAKQDAAETTSDCDLRSAV